MSTLIDLQHDVDVLMSPPTGEKINPGMSILVLKLQYDFPCLQTEHNNQHTYMCRSKLIQLLHISCAGGAGRTELNRKQEMCLKTVKSAVSKVNNELLCSAVTITALLRAKKI